MAMDQQYTTMTSPWYFGERQTYLGRRPWSQNLLLKDVDITDEPDWDIYGRLGTCWRDQREEPMKDIAIALASCDKTCKWAAGFH